MAASFRSAGTWSFSPNNVATPFTATPGAPAGKAVGDCLVLICASRSITATVATPSGWTLVTGFPKRSATASGGSIYVFTRIADGTATDTPSPVWTGLTIGTSGDSASAGILAYSGTQAVLDGTVQLTDTAASTTTSVIPAFTTGTNNSLVIGIALKIVDVAGTSTVATFTERVDASTTSGTGHNIAVSDKIQAVAGSSGTATVTWTATGSARSIQVSLGLKEAIADIALVVANASVATSAGSPALTQANTLAVAASSVAPTSQVPAITQANTLAVNGSSIASTIQSPAIVQ